jgi:hypothetical protein
MSKKSESNCQEFYCTSAGIILIILVVIIAVAIIGYLVIKKLIPYLISLDSLSSKMEKIRKNQELETIDKKKMSPHKHWQAQDLDPNFKLMPTSLEGNSMLDDRTNSFSENLENAHQSFIKQSNSENISVNEHQIYIDHQQGTNLSGEEHTHKQNKNKQNDGRPNHIILEEDIEETDRNDPETLEYTSQPDNESPEADGSEMCTSKIDFTINNNMFYGGGGQESHPGTVRMVSELVTPNGTFREKSAPNLEGIHEKLHSARVSVRIDGPEHDQEE